MINLYLFRCTDNIFTHALQHCFMLGRRDFHDACYPIIKDQLLTWESVPWAKSIEQSIPFRQRNWEHYTDELDYLVKNNLTRAFASYKEDQIKFIQDYLRTSVYTIGISYSAHDYDFLLNFFVLVHLHRQKTGLVPITPEDQQLRNQGVNLFRYYKNKFDKNGLVPKNIDPIGNYTMPALDLLDETKFFQHLAEIGGKDNTEVRESYHQWINIINKYFSNAE